MNVFAGVFLEVESRNTDRLRAPLDGMTGLVTLGGHDLEFTVGRERLIVLRDLIALWQVRIEVVLARKDRLVIDLQTKREGRARAELDGAAIQHRQRSRQAKTGRTRVRVRLVAKTRSAAAEDLRFRAQLRMNLETDNCFPGHLRRPCPV